MRIVIDTNVVASAVFFGGRPGELLALLLHRRLEAVATDRIVAEYQATVDFFLPGTAKAKCACRSYQLSPQWI